MMRFRERDPLFRKIVLLFVVVFTAYVVTGVGLIWVAYAQENLATTPHNIWSVPAGSDDASVKAYYDYLSVVDLSQRHEQFVINGIAITWVYGVAAVALAIFFAMLWSWYAKRQADLHPVEVYNDGYATERGGDVSLFGWVTFSFVGAYMVYYAVMNLIFGNIY